MLMNTTTIIADKISDFIDDWIEDDSYYLTICLDCLELEISRDIENEIDEILMHIEAVESFEIENNELILEINYFVLKSAFDERMKRGMRCEN